MPVRCLSKAEYERLVRRKYASGRATDLGQPGIGVTDRGNSWMRWVGTTLKTPEGRGFHRGEQTDLLAVDLYRDRLAELPEDSIVIVDEEAELVLEDGIAELLLDPG